MAEHLVLRCADAASVLLPLDVLGLPGVQAYAVLATLFAEFDEIQLDEPLPVPLSSGAVLVLVAWLVAAATAAPLEAAAPFPTAVRAAAALRDTGKVHAALQAAHFFGAAELEFVLAPRLVLLVQREFEAAQAALDGIAFTASADASALLSAMNLHTAAVAGGSWEDGYRKRLGGTLSRREQDWRRALLQQPDYHLAHARPPRPLVALGYLGGRDGAQGGPLQSMWWAAQQGNLAQLCWLLGAHGMTPNSQDEMDSHGFTPLTWAATNGHHECLDLLIVAGADVDASIDGYVRTQTVMTTSYNGAYVWRGTALHIAACGQPLCVERLLRAGADARKRNRSGVTARELAVSNRQAACVAVFDRWGISE